MSEKTLSEISEKAEFDESLSEKRFIEIPQSLLDGYNVGKED